jgi:hypothetical protein
LVELERLIRELPRAHFGRTDSFDFLMFGASRFTPTQLIKGQRVVVVQTHGLSGGAHDDDPHAGQTRTKYRIEGDDTENEIWVPKDMTVAETERLTRQQRGYTGPVRIEHKEQRSTKTIPRPTGGGVPGRLGQSRAALLRRKLQNAFRAHR